MRRLEFLINQVRRASENMDTDVVTGISTEEFVQYFNDAQERIQSLIHQAHPECGTFDKQGYINIVNQQEGYDLRDMVDASQVAFKSHIYTDASVSSVEQTEGNSYFTMSNVSNKERSTGFGYIMRDNILLLTPVPGRSIPLGLRIVYTQRLPKLDIRRGKITNIAAQVLTLSEVPTGTAFTDETDTVCIVSSDGTQTVLDADISSWNDGTGELTIATGKDISAASVGDYVVYGNWTTTHSELKEVCEKYLITYCENKIYMRDSSLDMNAQVQLLSAMEGDIVGLFADNGNDAVRVPISTTTYITY